MKMLIGPCAGRSSATSSMTCASGGGAPGSGPRLLWRVDTQRVLPVGIAGPGPLGICIIEIFEYYCPVAQVRGSKAGEAASSTPRDELQAFKARFFRALAHPVRIRILELLVQGGWTVQELQDVLSLEQPIVSQQL